MRVVLPVVLAVAVGAVIARALPCGRSGPSAAAVVAGRTISLAEVDGSLGNRLLNLRVREYAQRRRALDELLSKELLRREATRRKTTVERLQSEIPQKVTPATEDEARAVYNAARGARAGAPDEQVLVALTRRLDQTRLDEQTRKYLRELRGRFPVRLLLEAPRVHMGRVADAPVKGACTAPVTITEFADFQCPYCARLAPLLRQLLSMYDGQVSLVFRHCPLPGHRQAAMAAEAASCAGEQGRFWEMHDVMFKNSPRLSPADLKIYATAVNLDGERFAGCLDSHRYQGKWTRDRADAKQYGVTGTPVLFVSGRPLFGVPSLQQLVDVVDEEIARTAR